jgi:hypothetical protein
VCRFESCGVQILRQIRLSMGYANSSVMCVPFSTFNRPNRANRNTEQQVRRW